jgi:hypothetical protein
MSLEQQALASVLKVLTLIDHPKSKKYIQIAFKINRMIKNKEIYLRSLICNKCKTLININSDNRSSCSCKRLLKKL